MNSLPINKKIHSFKRGYTLIELLVVTTIVLLLAGGGIAAFSNFNKREKVLAAAKELQSYLRTAQTLSRVGERPTGCAELRGYRVRTTTIGSVKQVQLLASCAVNDIESRTYVLPAGTTLNNDIDMTFQNLHGGVIGAAVIQVTGGGLTYQFEVTRGGEITAGDFL